MCQKIATLLRNDNFDNKNGDVRILMAYVNVAEWSHDQIAEWLKGLDSVISQYIPLFLNHEVRGKELLNLRADYLENIGVVTIGHQELILEAVGQLRNFHYELNRENLQYLALRLSCAATSLFNEIYSKDDYSVLETQTLSGATNVIATVKPLACWLDRAPFSGQIDYIQKKIELLQLSFKMASNGHLDRFAEKPLRDIKESCQKLSVLADIIIQEISDPMVLQPATLDLATLKKRENELGFDILPSCTGIHKITDIKFGSPAHSSGKIEDGDEIVQVNYQTVVGWQPKEVLALCQECPADVLLTLKKRPRLTHTFGQIYMKPYRLPSRKRSVPYNRWGSLPFPRSELVAFELPKPRPIIAIPTPLLDEGNSSSDESENLSRAGSPTSDHISSQPRIYLPKPRSVVQRRNTTSGSSPISKRPNISIEQFWRELNNHKFLQHSGSAQMANQSDPDILSDNLYRRDKSVSYSTGLELSPRAKTCLGVGLTHPKVVKLKDDTANIASDRALTKVVKFHDQLVAGSNDGTLNNHEERIARERGRLDKSFSTPAYDFGEPDDSEFPLIREVIPESPTSVDSPNIILHSPQKDQIIEFMKSSEQIGGAMINQKNRGKNKSNGDIAEKVISENMFGEIDSVFTDTKVADKSGNIQHDQDKVGKIFETINIALLEHRKKEAELNNKVSNNTGVQSIFVTEFGESSCKKVYDSGMSEQIQIIQNELLEAINEQRKLTFPKVLEPVSKVDMPPEPPPRPLSTQKPGYIPPKLLKNIQKQDIQVIPNTDIVSMNMIIRNDIPLPISPGNKSLSGSISFETKHSNSNLSTSELSSSRSPLMPSPSLQKLEVDQKTPSPVVNKLETSISSLKPVSYDTSKSSLSPANSMVRGILSTGKSKSIKKKNSILAKRRKVSVGDLGAGDMQGFLHQRCRAKNSSNWDVRWCVLVGNTFYGFKYKNSTKAECLIFLSGFTVSKAQEVNSKQFAFKVYHTGTFFYFAADNVELMTAWVDCITSATLTNNDSWDRIHNSKKDRKVDESKQFSETDYSDDELQDGLKSGEKSKSSDNKQDKSEKSNKFGSLKKFARMQKSESQENVNQSSTSLDRKYLRFFSSKHSKNKEEKSKFKSTDVPVPTDQYRSYRKIPLSGPSMSNSSQSSLQTASSTSKITKAVQEESSQNIAKIKKIGPVDIQGNMKENLPDITTNHHKLAPNPINYIHASNPNLLDFEKCDFVTKPKCNAPFTKNIVQRPDNLIGFVTLERFMLDKQEEERRQVFSNRVLMGVERDGRADEKNLNTKQDQTLNDTNLQKQWDKIVPDVIYGENPAFLQKNITTAQMERIQNRCLPKTPDIIKTKIEVQDHNLTESHISRENKKNSRYGGKKKNDGYETIEYDDADKVKMNKDNNNIDIAHSVIPRKLSFNSVKETFDQNNCKVSPNLLEDVIKDHFINLFDTESSPDNSKVVGIDVNSRKDNNFSTSSKNVNISFNAKDLGYEVLYDDGVQTSSLSMSSNISTTTIIGDEKITLRKVHAEPKKPLPPPKTIKVKYSVSRQSSVTSIGDRKSTGPDMKPVFKQGDCPEKFWLDSLRRNDKLKAAKLNEHPGGLRPDKFFTKHSEPSTYMKSSEATIVKSDKLQNKGLSNNDNVYSVKVGDYKPLKSATQYTPMSLPLASTSKQLKTSPQFELSLDSRDPAPAASGISRIKQMFQHSGNSSSKNSLSANTTPIKEKTLLGSPRLHRAIFRKHHVTSPDEWSQDFIYSKGSPSASDLENVGNDPYLFSVFPNESALSMSNCESTNISNASTPDYPHLEYPPVFEPETYTLADPGPSILRKKNYDA